MHSRRLISGFLVFLMSSISQLLFASQEGMLAWNSISIQSSGIGESGPVTIMGAQSSTGISVLKIVAFGREFVLNEKQIQQLAGLPVNGIQLTYEAGYKELGGRTLYIVLTKGFTSGIQTGKWLTITERGDIKIQEYKLKQ